MSYKGIRGGDPARRPAKLTIEYTCEFCGAGHADYVLPKNLNSYVKPRFCDNVCMRRKDEAEARELARKFLDTGLPAAELVEHGMFKSVLKYGGLVAMAKEDLETVVVRTVVCKHCGSKSDYYCSRNSVNQSNSFCGGACARSYRRKMPYGVSCPRPEKRRFETHQEVLAAVTQTNREIQEKEGPHSEPLTEYRCKCGMWHFGHESKAIAEKEIIAVRNSMVKLLNSLIGCSETRGIK